MDEIHIGDRPIGAGHACFLIAEVSQNHDGSLGLAHAFVDVAADSGADAVKFQTHIAAAESTLDEPFRIQFSQQDATRYDYWKRMEFTPEQWAGLHHHATERGLIFLSSAFSIEAVELLGRLGMPAWKIGSGEFATSNLIDAMAAAGGPLLYSTGMSRFDEIATAVEALRKTRDGFALFQCTSSYPTPLERVGLNVMDRYRTDYNCPVGLSDHSGSVYPALAAIARRADLLEVHLTIDKRMFGPDVPVSLPPDQFRLLAEMRDACCLMDRHPVDKDALAEELVQMRAMFTKSVAPTRILAAGTRLDRGDLTLKKPGTGIPSSELEALVGRVLARSVSPNRVLSWSDLQSD